MPARIQKTVCYASTVYRFVHHLRPFIQSAQLARARERYGIRCYAASTIGNFSQDSSDLLMIKTRTLSDFWKTH